MQVSFSFGLGFLARVGRIALVRSELPVLRIEVRCVVRRRELWSMPSAWPTSWRTMPLYVSTVRWSYMSSARLSLSVGRSRWRAPGNFPERRVAVNPGVGVAEPLGDTRTSGFRHRRPLRRCRPVAREACSSPVALRAAMGSRPEGGDLREVASSSAVLGLRPANRPATTG